MTSRNSWRSRGLFFHFGDSTLPLSLQIANSTLITSLCNRRNDRLNNFLLVCSYAELLRLSSLILHLLQLQRLLLIYNIYTLTSSASLFFSDLNGIFIFWLHMIMCASCLDEDWELIDCSLCDNFRLSSPVRSFCTSVRKLSTKHLQWRRS